MEKYKYTGPTMLVGENGVFKLKKGMEVLAEVNVNIATIKTLKNYLYKTDLELDTPVNVAAKYLEPIKIKPIHFDPKDDEETGDFFDKLFGEIGKISAECHFPFPDEDCLEKYKESLRKGGDGVGKPSEEVLDNIRKAAREANDNHEVGGTHYKSTIEPWDFIYANSLDFDAGNAVKYLCRYKKKGGAEDIKKAISYCEHILKTQYGVDKD